MESARSGEPPGPGDGRRPAGDRLVREVRERVGRALAALQPGRRGRRHGAARRGGADLRADRSRRGDSVDPAVRGDAVRRGRHDAGDAAAPAVDPAPRGDTGRRPRRVNTAEKIRSAAEAARWRERLSGPLVLTNGVFDLLHAGHVSMLEAARGEGAALVVGVGSDRPIVPERERARLLAALASVDCVVLFDEETPLALIERLRPDVLVKGADYTRASIVGADQVEGWGGRVVRVPL